MSFLHWTLTLWLKEMDVDFTDPKMGCQRPLLGDVPDGPVAKTPNAGGPGSIPGQEARSHGLQLWVRKPELKSPRAATKTLCSQINIFKKKRKKEKDLCLRTATSGYGYWFSFHFFFSTNACCAHNCELLLLVQNILRQKLHTMKCPDMKHVLRYFANPMNQPRWSVCSWLEKLRLSSSQDWRPLFLSCIKSVCFFLLVVELHTILNSTYT